MSDLGNLLRQGREARGLTLAQAQSDTHLRRAYIEAIEDGRWEQLPDSVYTRGLVASYARYLELDESEVKRLFSSESGGRPPSALGVDSHQPLNEPLQAGRPRWVRPLLALVLVAVAFAVWWNWAWVVLWERWLLAGAPNLATATPATTQASALAAATASANPEVVAEVPAAELPTPTSAALPLPTPAPPPTDIPVVAPTATTVPISGLAVRVEITSSAWIRVVADGALAFEGTLNAGEVKEWLALQSLLFRSGNAGGTKVAINGQDVGALGAEGDVIERLWLWQDNQIVIATPEG